MTFHRTLLAIVFLLALDSVRTGEFAGGIHQDLAHALVVGVRRSPDKQPLELVDVHIGITSEQRFSRFAELAERLHCGVAPLMVVFSDLQLVNDSLEGVHRSSAPRSGFYGEVVA